MSIMFPFLKESLFLARDLYDQRTVRDELTLLPTSQSMEAADFQYVPGGAGSIRSPAGSVHLLPTQPGLSY